MPTTVRVADPSTALDIAPAVLHLPDEYAQEVAKYVRSIIIPRLRRLTPKRTGTVAASYTLLPVRILAHRDPVFEIAYARYGDYVDFIRPVQVGPHRIEKVPELIRAVFRANASLVYTLALRDFGAKYGVDLEGFRVAAQIRKFVVRRLLRAIVTRTSPEASVALGRLIGFGLSVPISRQNDRDRLEFLQQFSGSYDYYYE